MYKIHWKALRTSATGHGTKAFLKREAAQRYCDELNHDYWGFLEHWIEKVDDEKTQSK